MAGAFDQRLGSCVSLRSDSKYSKYSDLKYSEFLNFEGSEPLGIRSKFYLRSSSLKVSTQKLLWNPLVKAESVTNPVKSDQTLIVFVGTIYQN